MPGATRDPEVQQELKALEAVLALRPASSTRPSASLAT